MILFLDTEFTTLLPAEACELLSLALVPRGRRALRFGYRAWRSAVDSKGAET